MKIAYGKKPKIRAKKSIPEKYHTANKISTIDVVVQKSIVPVIEEQPKIINAIFTGCDNNYFKFAKGCLTSFCRFFDKDFKVFFYGQNLSTENKKALKKWQKVMPIEIDLRNEIKVWPTYYRHLVFSEWTKKMSSVKDKYYVLAIDIDSLCLKDPGPIFEEISKHDLSLYFTNRHGGRDIYQQCFGGYFGLVPNTKSVHFATTFVKHDFVNQTDKVLFHDQFYLWKTYKDLKDMLSCGHLEKVAKIDRRFAYDSTAIWIPNIPGRRHWKSICVKNKIDYM